MKHIDLLKSLNACQEAIDFAAKFPTLKAAWMACERSDWMFWLLERAAKGRAVGCRRERVAGDC